MLLRFGFGNGPSCAFGGSFCHLGVSRQPSDHCLSHYFKAIGPRTTFVMMHISQIHRSRVLSHATAFNLLHMDVVGLLLQLTFPRTSSFSGMTMCSESSLAAAISAREVGDRRDTWVPERKMAKERSNCLQRLQQSIKWTTTAVKQKPAQKSKLVTSCNPLLRGICLQC